ncbi:MAG: hypothetical protein RL544_1010 [Bacteroidota bacterium]|jgi:hypothetical protein
MSNHYVNSKKKVEIIAANEITAIDGSIKILAEIIANQIIKKLLQDEQLGITASADDSQICEKSQAA